MVYKQDEEVTVIVEIIKTHINLENYKHLHQCVEDLVQRNINQERRRKRGKKCSKWKELGHFAKLSQTNYKQQTLQFQQKSGTHYNFPVAQPQEDNNINHIRQEQDDTHIFNIQSNNQLQKYPITINNIEIIMLIDSDATLNILDKSSYNLINPAPPLKSTNVKIFPNQATTRLKIKGIFETTIKNEQNETIATFYVTTGKSGIRLCWISVVKKVVESVCAFRKIPAWTISEKWLLGWTQNMVSSLLNEFVFNKY